MRKRTKKMVEYIKEYAKDGDLIIPRYSKKLTVVNFTRRYHNTLHILADLTGNERLVLDYLTEAMDEENKIFTNADARKSLITFISFITKGKHNIPDNSLKMHMTKLTKAGLILPTGTRGAMIVNPEYFFGGSEEERLKLIRKLLEEKIIVHVPKAFEMEEHPLDSPASTESSHKADQEPEQFSEAYWKKMMDDIDNFK